MDYLEDDMEIRDSHIHTQHQILKYYIICN